MRLTPCTKQRLHGEERGGEVSASLQIKRNVLEAEGNLFPGVCNRASQLPDCIWSHPAALAGEAAGWGAAQHRGWASPGWALSEPPSKGSFQAEGAWFATIPKATGQGGLSLRGVKMRGGFSERKYWFFSVPATHLTKNIVRLKANVNISLWHKYPL